MARYLYISLCLLLSLPSLAMKKKSVISAYNLNQLSPTPVIIGLNPLTHVFETKMVGYSYAPDWNEDFIVTDLQNIISLEIFPYDAVTLDYDVDVSITFNIKHFSFPSNDITEEEHTLTVNYNPDPHKKFKKVDLLKLTGGTRVLITITDIQASALPAGVTNADIFSKVVLSAYTEDTRYYKTSIFHEIDCGSISFTNNNYPEIEMHWDHLPFAEEYDIELVHNDQYGNNPSSSSAVLSPFSGTYSNQQDDFYGNSTRITTKNNYLVLPLINELSLYRVRIRPVGRQGQKFQHRFEYSWSCMQYINYTNQPHTGDSLNYQTIATYAEEGKYKIVNEYFDGRMAARQKVTKLQSSNYSLVQESIYDGIGRKAIEVLPGPVNNGVLDFYHGFNNNLLGQPYSFRDFEPTNGCTQSPQPMSDQSGTSFYYSSDHFNSLNPAEQKTHLKLIPEAHGFPFSQTRFMNDNTNRPIAQGGVGKDHIIGSSHETEISYVYPTQSELDRLFGTEVGYAKYYKKVVTEDPNNQLSFAYQDLKGNTIATSLWGGVANLDTLETYKANVFSDDLTGFTKTDSLNFELYTEYVFLVAEDDVIYTFDYGFLAATYEDLTCDQSNICYDCIYDLGIYLIQTDCNDTLYEDSRTLGNIDPLDQMCQGFSWDSDLGNIQLKKGNHTIRVTLSVNESAADAYVEDYIKDPNNQCIKQLSEFEEEYVAEIPDVPCHFDCENFEQEIADLEARIQKAKNILSQSVTIEQAQELMSQIAQFQASINAWEEVCDSDLNFCEQAKLRMLADLSPFGQYASIAIDTTNFVYAPADPLSIFYSATLLGDNHEAYFLNPQFSFPYTTTQGGQIDLRDSLLVDSISLNEFVNNYWQDEWALQFLQFHPEFCYLEMCNHQSADFDRNLMNVSSAAEAISEGYVLPNGMGNPHLMLYDDMTDPDDVHDPQFQSSGLLHNHVNDMNAELVNYFHNYPSALGLPSMSIYELAVATVCQSLEVDGTQNGSGPPPIQNCNSVLAFDYADQEIADRLWDAYRGLYFSVKQKYEYLKRTDLALLQGCYNECIGRDSINILRDAFGFHMDNQDICNLSNFPFFKEKDKVFPGPYDVPGLELVEDVYDYENLDGIANTIMDWVELQLDSSGCGLEGVIPDFPIDQTSQQGTCLSYSCMDELPGFMQQLITGSEDSRKFYQPEGMEITAPACFGLSPFLPYYISDAATDGTTGVYTAMIGSDTLDTEACAITLEFEFLDTVTYSHPLGSYIFRIHEFTNFELDTSTIDQNCEIQGFTAIAHSKLLNVLGLCENCVTPLRVRGSFSCAKLGRCCCKGVEEAITSCLDVPNVDNPSTVEEELWIGESNPYFDPSWVRNPCNSSDSIIMDSAEIICIGDSTALCCPDTIIPGEVIDSCEQERIELALHNALLAYQQYIQDKSEEIKEAYMRACLAATQRFNTEYPSTEHHFVLSYYDQSGNLTRTVPPNGTYDYYNRYTDPDRTFQTDLELNPIPAARNAKQINKPDYSVWDTRYTYNSLNQITTQNLPDHGTASLVGQPSSRDGVTKFIYDELGRLTYSQNPRQAVNEDYSYTVYDDIGRIVESGQKRKTGFPFTQNLYFIGMGMSSGVSPYGGWEEKVQITYTYYDHGPGPAIESGMPNNRLENLRGRVAWAGYYETEADLVDMKPSSSSYYNYDVLGNVKSLVQRLRNGFSKSIEYEYDLVSGNVNKVIYQRDKEDQFIHQYEYDADNRIIQVETSTDGLIWDQDARHFYYPHGPLARTEIGGEEVQGRDYVYTIHGWIKGENSVGLLPDYDPGQDGSSSGWNSSFAADEVGYMLNYYQGDYEAISGQQPFSPDVGVTSNDLFNGNIRNMSTSIGHFIRENTDYGYVSNDYSYDQLNRITEMRPWDDFIPTSNSWSPNDDRDETTWPEQPYFTDYSYDGNGNIHTLQRNGGSDQVGMDKLSYIYKHTNNRLTAVRDVVNRDNYPLDPSNPDAVHDIDSRPIFNYIYDEVGSLIKDRNEGLEITWNVQGKVRHIADANGPPEEGGTGSERHIDMIYDPLGNRIAKVVDGEATYYVRDAQGNLMSTYAQSDVPMRYIPAEDVPGNDGPGNESVPDIGRRIKGGSLGNLPISDGDEPEMYWTSAYIYGSDRVGEFVANKKIGGPKKSDGPVDIGFIPYSGSEPIEAVDNGLSENARIGVFAGILNGLNIPDLSGLYESEVEQSEFSFMRSRSEFDRDRRQYELTNHLSNVLAIISDRRSIGTSSNFLSNAEVTAANDYYPGGMRMPFRTYSYSDTTYRFKHQGQESDDEIAGRGTNYFYKYRMSDARLNRFWSVDPLYATFPQSSPYSFGQNRLMNGIELEGMQWAPIKKVWGFAEDCILNLSKAFYVRDKMSVVQKEVVKGTKKIEGNNKWYSKYKFPFKRKINPSIRLTENSYLNETILIKVHANEDSGADYLTVYAGTHVLDHRMIPPGLGEKDYLEYELNLSLPEPSPITFVFSDNPDGTGSPGAGVLNFKVIKDTYKVKKKKKRMPTKNKLYKRKASNERGHKRSMSKKMRGNKSRKKAKSSPNWRRKSKKWNKKRNN